MEENLVVMESILLNNFYISKKRCKACLYKGCLVWEFDRDGVQRKIRISEILAVEYAIEDDQDRYIIDPHCFTIHYAAQSDGNKFRKRSITLKNNDVRQVGVWVKTLKAHLAAMTDRPKHILIFVNPYGGKKNALKIYERYGKPLFALAGVETSVVVSQRANQIKDIMMTHSLDNFDAVGCVGGDGTFAEVFNGLVLRAFQESGLDSTDWTKAIPKPALPVGVIPGGSTDTIAYCLHGTTDVRTAVLHIILGQTGGLDLASVGGMQSQLRFYASVVSYGYLGDVARDSEKFRWMGPKRYDFSGFRKFFSNRGYEGEIAYLQNHSDPRVGPKCTENCKRCFTETPTIENNESEAEPVWRTVKGKFFMVSGANLSCACARSPNGFSPYCHSGDGCVDLVLVRHTNMLNNIRLLLKLSSKRSNSNIFSLPFVDVFRTQEFRFHAVPNTGDGLFGGTRGNSRLCNLQSTASRARIVSGFSVWNCDGEIVKEPDLQVRVHCQLLKVFKRRITDTVPDELSSIGFQNQIDE